MYKIYCLIWVICFLIKNKGHFEIDMQDDTFNDEIRMQASIAIDEADVIIFVVDGKEDITKNDYVIILGDFGLLWENTPSELEKELLDFYNNFGCPILWLDGNHENFKILN